MNLDDTTMARLRQAAAARPEAPALWRLGDHEVLALAAAFVPDRAAAPLAPRALAGRMAPAPAPAASPSPAAAPRRAPASATPAAAPPSTFDADLDAAATAAALQRAAAAGVPFCEVCAR